MKNEDIPLPDTSGITGGQKPEEDYDTFVKSSPLEGLHLAKTLTGLTTSHSKAFGGEVTSALIAGATTQVHFDYIELKSKYNALSEKLDIQRDECEKIKIKNAVLLQKIKSDASTKHLRNFAITIGTSIFGTGIFLSRSKLDLYAYGAFGVGIILLLLGWLSGSKEEDK